jgi:hypothetical protein
MTAQSILAIGWLTVTTILSARLCSIIHAHITSKAPIEQTVIDLINRDSILYLLFLTLSMNLTLISCLIADKSFLEFSFAFFCSILIYFFIISLAISFAVSSGLRLLSIVNVSVEAGVQLLGPDDQVKTS